MLHDVAYNGLIVCSPIVIYPWIFLFILLTTGEGTENDLSYSGLHAALGCVHCMPISCMIC